MTLSIIFILLVALVAFVHYTQGFFSATLSAIIAIISSMIAIGWHEDVITAMKPGKYADSAHAMVICGLFAVTYLICRTLFDKLVPGNVRFPASIDKVGAVVMGIVAGIFATGVAAIAVQSMPFGPSVGGYARYVMGPDREVRVGMGVGQRTLDRKVYDELKSARFEKSEESGLLFPVDSIVLGFTSTASAGALSGRTSFSEIHPDYIQELFGQRLGIEVGTKRTALNWTPGLQVEVKGLYLYTPTGMPRDVDTLAIRGFKGGEDEKKAAEPSPLVTATLKGFPPDYKALVVRIEMKDDARDPDNFFRFSPASARLVLKDGGKFQNFFPIGTLDYEKSYLWVNRIDDPIFIDMKGESAVVDLVYMVPQASLEPVTTDKKAIGAQFKLPPGTFFEMKRLARADLTDEAEGGGIVKQFNTTNAPPAKGASILRKVLIDPRAVKKEPAP